MAYTQSVRLLNGVDIPVLGFGTYKMDDEAAAQAVQEAIRRGYRHIDTASYYKNEKGVGLGIAQCGLPRDQIFLTSKMWNDEQGYEQTLEAFERSIQKLGVDYLDLYLIHWPQPQSKDTWRAMEKLYGEGKIRAIGVSNFSVEQIRELAEDSSVMPMVNQVELHPCLSQPEMRAFCREKGIALTAWSPLDRGKSFELSAIQDLCKKYGKTPAQIVLRWEVQMGLVTIPKTANPTRMQENASIFDFALTDEEMLSIESLDQ